jgi:hypothetical protein
MESHTYPRDSIPFKTRITQAEKEFQKIHERYRSLVGGLYARMWQGKCIEEQNEMEKALGIYNELLSHPARTDAIQKLQSMALAFRLICLNSEQRKDYQLAIADANVWLSRHAQDLPTNVELSIRYQTAVAHEKLLESIKQNPADPQLKADSAQKIEGHARAAMKEARIVAKYRGEFQSHSKAILKRLKPLLPSAEK